MKITRVIAIGIIAASLGLGVVQAKTLRNAGEPSEFPPSSFKGKQYVDSKGCVYIRAGIDGNVTWVPRVARNRQVICNAKPTFAKAPAPQIAKPVKQAIILKPAAAPKPAAKVAVKAAAKPVVKPAPKPVVKTAAKPVVIKQAAAPKPVRKTVRKPLLVRRPIKTVASTTTAPKVMTRPAPKRMVKPVVATPVTRKVVRAPQRTVVTTNTNVCPGRTGVSARYSGSPTRGLSVRCGPQAAPVHSGTVVRQRVAVAAPKPVRQVAARRVAPQPTILPAETGTRPAAAAPIVTHLPKGARIITGGTRVAPKHVYQNQLNAAAVGTPPKGYRKVWKDDRLNPHRAHQNLVGKARMELVWTRTVPRRLINRATGQDVTTFFPDLAYPYVSPQQQRRAASATISTQGKAVRRVVKRPAKVIRRKQATKVVARTKQATQPRKAAATGHRYVQVGTFGVAANASKTAARLQGLGLPVRYAKFTKGGKEYRIVLAGPFGAQGDVNAALNTARRAGFKDAFARK